MGNKGMEASGSDLITHISYSRIMGNDFSKCLILQMAKSGSLALGGQLRPSAKAGWGKKT